MRALLFSVVVIGAYVFSSQAYPQLHSKYSEGGVRSLYDWTLGPDSPRPQGSGSFKVHDVTLKREDITSSHAISSLNARSLSRRQNDYEVNCTNPLSRRDSTSLSLVRRAPLTIQLPNLPSSFPRYSPTIRSRNYQPPDKAIWIGRNGKDNWGSTFPFGRDICIANLFGQGALFIRGLERGREYVIAARFALTNPLTISRAIDAALGTEMIRKIDLFLPFSGSIWDGLENAEAYSMEFERRLKEVFPNCQNVVQTTFYDFVDEGELPYATDQYYDFLKGEIKERQELIQWGPALAYGERER